MPSYDVIESTNSYHGIKTTYGMAGMPKIECATCDKSEECRKAPSWIKLCEVTEEKKTD